MGSSLLKFEYHAIEPSGAPVTGTVIAHTPEEARSDLEQRGLNVEFIGSPTRPEFISAIDVCLQNRETIIECMRSCDTQAKWLRSDKPWNTLQKSLSNGATANEFVAIGSLAMFLPFVMMFDPNRNDLFAGDRKSEFETWTRFYMQQANRRRFVWRLLSYPVVIITLYLAILIAMAYGIIPQFRRVYEEFEVALPKPTERLLWLSDQVTDHPIRFILMIAVTLTVAYGIYRCCCWFLDQIQDVPILGKFTRSSKKQLLAISRLTATLAELLRLNAPLPVALKIAGLASGNRAMINETMLTARMLTTSRGRQDVRFVSNFLPSTLVCALQAGPDGQPSIELIQQLSTLYAERLEQRIHVARGIAAPAMTILMAILTWNMISALMSPLISLITSLSGG